MLTAACGDSKAAECEELQEAVNDAVSEMNAWEWSFSEAVADYERGQGTAQRRDEAGKRWREATAEVDRLSAKNFRLCGS